MGAVAAVMGSYERGMFAEALMGSVVGRVFAHTECLMVLVKTPKA